MPNFCREPQRPDYPQVANAFIPGPVKMALTRLRLAWHENTYAGRDSDRYSRAILCRNMRLLGCFLLAVAAWSQDYYALRWRMIGPFRGGRTVAATGIPGRPNEFLVAATNGGVWKSTDFGRVWRPVFDDQPTGSIGAVAVAPSSPDTIYVGSGVRIL